MKLMLDVIFILKLCKTYTKMVFMVGDGLRRKNIHLLNQVWKKTFTMISLKEYTGEGIKLLTGIINCGVSLYVGLLFKNEATVLKDSKERCLTLL